MRERRRARSQLRANKYTLDVQRVTDLQGIYLLAVELDDRRLSN